MNTLKEKMFNFTKKYKEYIISLGIILALFTILLIVNGAFPYGENTILISDSHIQIGAFFRHIFDVFSGDASLFYTNKIGGGVEMVSTIEYMLLSPFFLVVLLGGKNNYLGWFNISFLLMLVFVNFVFIWFTKKYFKNLNETIRIIFSLLFTFSAYICLNFSFITWVIYPALLLLVVDAFLKLVYDKKVLPFALLMVWYVVNSFSLGIFSNIILLVLFTLYILFNVEKTERGGACLRLFIAYVVAVLLSLVVLFPSVTAMLNSSRLSKNILGLLELRTTIFAQKITGVVFDGLVVVFATLYFVKTGLKTKFNKFLITAISLLFAPILFDTVMKFLNGGAYFGFPARNYFILEFMLFVCALNLFDKNLLEFQESGTSKIAKTMFVFMTSLCVIAFVCVEVFFFDSLGVSLKNPVLSEGTTWFMVLMCFVFALLVLFIVVANKRKLFSIKMSKVSLLFVMIFTLVFNFLIITGGAHIETDKFNEAKQLINSNELVDGKLKDFKVEYGEAKLTNWLDLNVQNSSYFSSLVSGQTLQSVESLGINASTNGYSGAGGMLMSDALMNHKYFISRFEQNRPYLTLVDKSENYYLYKNKLVTTGAILLDENFKFESDSYLKNMEALQSLLGVSGTLFENVDVSTTKTSDDILERDCYLTKHTFVAPTDGILYISTEITYAKLSELETISEFYETNEVFMYERDKKNMGYSDICYVEAGEEYTFYLCPYANWREDTVPDFVFMNYDIAEQICLKLQEKDVELKYTKDGWTVSCTAQQKSQLVVFATDLTGMTYSVNGQSVESKNNIGYFASFILEEGNHKIVASFEYEHKILWLIFAVVAILISVVILLAYKKWKFVKFEKAMFVCFVIVSTLIVSLVYGVGILWSFCLILA